MAVNWYALRSKPRKEDVVCKLLRENGYDVFYPRLRVNPVNPRARKVKPYFPGYMFVNVDLDVLGTSIFQWMPHTLGLVTFGDVPAVVPDHLIQTIRQKVQEIAEAGGEVFDGLKPGDKVKIHTGPFEGYEAIFDSRLAGSERVRVLLQLLDTRRVPIEMSSAYISQKR